MEVETKLVKVEFKCKHLGTPITMNIEFPMTFVYYGQFYPLINEDSIIREVENYAKCYDLTDVEFLLDDMGKIDWDKICNILVRR